MVPCRVIQEHTDKAVEKYDTIQARVLIIARVKGINVVKRKNPNM